MVYQRHWFPMKRTLCFALLIWRCFLNSLVLASWNLFRAVPLFTSDSFTESLDDLLDGGLEVRVLNLYQRSSRRFNHLRKIVCGWYVTFFGCWDIAASTEKLKNHLRNISKYAYQWKMLFNLGLTSKCKK